MSTTKVTDNVRDVTAVDAKLAELKVEYVSKQYARDRVLAYPPVSDQLDDLYHNGIPGWKTTIKTIKDKYPKQNKEKQKWLEQKM